MKHQELEWKTRDGAKLFAQAWEPETEIVGVVCLVHGLGEHSGRYAHVAQYMTKAGYAVLGFDLRGHGRSEGKRGHIPSYDLAMEDIALLIEEAGRRWVGKPLFLYGHSLGGNFVINYALRCSSPVEGVISTSPVLGLDNPPRLKMMLGKLLYKVAPTFTMPNGLDVTGLARDEKVVAEYKADPLIHDQVSAALGLGFLEAGDWAMERAEELKKPLLLIHGDEDRLTSCYRSEQFARRAPGNATFKKWAGGYHELHNDFEQQALLTTVREWMDAVRQKS
jgi:acylglycerol lipase